MASVELSRRAGPVVGYPPLSEMSSQGRPGGRSDQEGEGRIDPVPHDARAEPGCAPLHVGCLGRPRRTRVRLLPSAQDQ
jgi:hypothetical protein